MMREDGWTVTSEPIRPEQLFDMDEVWIVGTTAYVALAVSFDGKPLFAGPQALDWMDRLQEDVQRNPALRDVL
jgi:branched-subunit amino acid aminotransferase/4-amino-4-deoxychorismate lyase